MVYLLADALERTSVTGLPSWGQNWDLAKSIAADHETECCGHLDQRS